MMLFLARLLPFWLLALYATALSIDPEADNTDCYNARFSVRMNASEVNNTYLIGFNLTGVHSSNGTRTSYAKLAELDSFWHYLRSQQIFTDGSTQLGLSWAINAWRDYIPADEYFLTARLDNVTGARIPGGGDASSFAIAKSTLTTPLDCSAVWLRAKSSSKTRNSLNKGAIAGIIIAAVVGFIVVWIISVHAWRRRWRIAALFVRFFSAIARRILPARDTKRPPLSRPRLEQQRAGSESQAPFSLPQHASDSAKGGLPPYAEGAAAHELAILPEEPSAPPSYDSLFDRFILRDEEVQRRSSAWEGRNRWRRVFGV